MMAQAKWIYILLIKVNDLFSQNLLKEIENMFLIVSIVF